MMITCPITAGIVFSKRGMLQSFSASLFYLIGMFRFLFSYTVYRLGSRSRSYSDFPTADGIMEVPRQPQRIHHLRQALVFEYAAVFGMLQSRIGDDHLHIEPAFDLQGHAFQAFLVEGQFVLY